MERKDYGGGGGGVCYRTPQGIREGLHGFLLMMRAYFLRGSQLGMEPILYNNQALQQGSVRAGETCPI